MLSSLRNIAALLVVALALSACVSTGPAVAPDKATVADINRLSGMDATLDAAQSAMGTASSQLTKSMPAKARSAFRSAAADAFNAQRMRAGINSRMQGKLSQGDLAQLAEFYASPVGRRITSAEISAARTSLSPATAKSAIGAWQRLNTTDPARASLYRRLLRSTHAEQRASLIALSSVNAMFDGMSRAINDPTFNRVMRPLAAQYRTELRTQLPLILGAGTTYAYKSLSMDDLRAYAAFVETGPARRYYSAATSALGPVLATEARRFGEKLGQSMKQ